jgi:HPt (histidine-containing phosphotransfer) domain-containing protein
MPSLPETPHGSAPVVALHAIDLRILLASAADDRSLARDLMALFIETSEPMFARLEAAIEAGDCRESQHQSHALTGATALLGAAALTALLKDVERIGRNNRQQDLGTHLPALRPAFAQVMQEVRMCLQHFDTPAGLAMWPTAGS